LDVHLMIVHPERYLEVFRKAGAEIITVHLEACPHLHRTVQEIQELGAKAGVAINPHSPVELLSEVIQDLDVVCVMSVNPGFGGQKFIENTYEKVSRLKEMILSKNSNTLIEIDGGVNVQNAPKLIQAGVDILVAGSFVFNSTDPQGVISQLKSVRK
jgi:ribulose-phosphate 3-epimerase